MPLYDCGAPECEECQLTFGPDRSKAVANYKAREAYYATLPLPAPPAPKAASEPASQASPKEPAP